MKIPDWLSESGPSGFGFGHAYATSAAYSYKAGYGCGGRYEYGADSGKGWGEGALFPNFSEITQLELLFLLVENENT